MDAAPAAFFDYRMVQSAVFWRREVFEKHGLFDPTCSYCFEHEFYLRLLTAGERCQPLETVIASSRGDQKRRGCPWTFPPRIGPLVARRLAQRIWAGLRAANRNPSRR